MEELRETNLEPIAEGVSSGTSLKRASERHGGSRDTVSSKDSAYVVATSSGFVGSRSHRSVDQESAGLSIAEADKEIVVEDTLSDREVAAIPEILPLDSIKFHRRQAQSARRSRGEGDSNVSHVGSFQMEDPQQGTPADSHPAKTSKPMRILLQIRCQFRAFLAWLLYCGHERLQCVVVFCGLSMMIGILLALLYSSEALLCDIEHCAVKTTVPRRAVSCNDPNIGIKCEKCKTGYKGNLCEDCEGGYERDSPTTLRDAIKAVQATAKVAPLAKFRCIEKNNFDRQKGQERLARSSGSPVHAGVKATLAEAASKKLA